MAKKETIKPKQSTPFAIKDTTTIVNKRVNWLGKLNVDDKEELLFQLEMNLKGLDRFFNLNNHSFSSFEQLITRDFSEELKIVETVINQIVVITGDLLQEHTKNLFYFQRFILDKLLEDFSRDNHLKRSVRQELPEESLQSLRLAFINYRQLISALKVLGSDVQYLEFNSIGQLITREIARNKFFNPLDNKPFVPEYDRIMTPRISQIIFGLLDPDMRKKTSIIYLALHRLLHYLQYVDPKEPCFETLKSHLLIFSLINSEIKTLLHYLESDFFLFLEARSEPLVINEYRLPKSGKVPPSIYIKPAQLRGSLESLVYQLRMELRNVNKRVLKDIIKINTEHRIRGAIENSKGILTNLLQQVVVFLSQEFDRDISGEDIFTVFTSRLRQSLSIRRDIFVFREIMSHHEEIIETRFDIDTLQCYKVYLEKLSSYIEYFHRNTASILRYDDATEFQKFFDLVYETHLDDLDINYKLESFKLSAKYFKIFLDTMLGNIANRSELQNTPLDMDEVNTLLKQYV